MEIREFSPRISIFKQLDIALVGVVHWVTASLLRFSPRKSIFKQFANVLFREKPPLHCSSRVVKIRQTIQNHGKAIIADNCSKIVAENCSLMQV